jgi:hypothetical protein
MPQMISPGFLINLVQGTTPTIQFQLVDRAETAVDITGKTLYLVVKRDIEDADVKALFDLVGVIVTALSGVFSVDFTGKLGLAGTFPAVLRWWDSGDPLTRPPRDAYAGQVEISDALILKET